MTEMRNHIPSTICLLASLAVANFVAIHSANAQHEYDPQNLVRQYGKLPQYRFYRHASYVYDAVLRFAQLDQSRISLADQFVRAFYEGQWVDVRLTLRILPEDLADRIYSKMLGDLAGRYVPVLTLDDFVGLADACPGELNADRVRKLGILCRAAVAKEQGVWLKRVVEKGTLRLGVDGARRLITGRILMHANFDDLAREYLPNASEASRIEDLEVRGEIMNFIASQEELDEFQQTQMAELWVQKAEVLTDPQADSGKKQQAADQLADLMGKAPIASVEPWVRSLVQKDLDAMLRLATALGKRSQSRINDANIALRANNLKAHECVLLSVSERADLSKPPWHHLATGMTDWWILEAEHTFQNRPGYRANSRPRPHVEPGALLDSQPDGAWAQALPASLRGRIDVCLSKAVLVSDQYQQAVKLIVDMAGRNRDAAVSLAEEYLKAWAHRHDPHVPEAVRKQHNLPNDARIMVTPMMMEKNIASLAEMMQLFREKGIRPRNGELLVDAFDVCYSNAEVYRKSHIEKVFGQIEEMDESVFFHMVRMMTQGLSSRWRKMDVQQASGTRRTQQETLEMVRTGYQTAVDFCARRGEEHQDAWRVLTLAGSLLSDWGDFEYYQQLGGDTGTNRVEAFREKNNLAEEYFARAADVYARQVPQLGRGKYSTDVYLAWFHSLLGINSNGNINLSKLLDRRALNRIRDMMQQGLPKNACKTHVDTFAKHVNARMEDTKNPLHEELKYKYLAASLVITNSSPFSFQANNKVSYYDELLDEIRLEARVDGPNTIFRDHEFGIILSVYHTEAMGRMANFGEYLTNNIPPGASRSRSRQSLVTTYRVTEVQGRRDELEMNIREALSLFFDIKSIVFSPEDVQPRPTDRPGWEETILAYVHAKAKDSSVDKIPRIQMSLGFMDLTGPVTISAESAETMIKVTDKQTLPRPFHKVDLTQTLDTRSLANTEEALLEVKVTACGLVPEIEELLDIDALGEQLPVARIDPHGGTLVRQLNSWGDTVHIVSERQWTIALDASSLVQEPRRIEFRLPAGKVDDATIKCQAYVDMDLIDLDTPLTTIGEGHGLAEPIAEAVGMDPRRLFGSTDPRILYGSVAAGVVLILIIAFGVVRLVRGRRERPLRARDVFHMPSQVDGFVVVQLLRSLGTSELVRLSVRQRAEMQQEIDKIQGSCFNGNGSQLSDDELRRVTKKWLKAAC